MSIHPPPPLKTATAALIAALAAPVASAEPLRLDCVVTPSRTLDLATAVPGLVEHVGVERGDEVRAGEVVATLASEIEQSDLAIARARVQMTAETRLWQASLEHDQVHHQRLASLHTRQAIASMDRDRAARDVELSRWKVQRAEEQTALRRLELDRAERVLEQKTVRSPIDGVVVQRFKSPGEYAEDEPVLRIAQLDPLHVETIVPMEHYGRIDKGARARVVIEGRPGTDYEATVSTIDRLGDPASGTFGLRLDLPNPDHALPAGFKCKVELLDVPRMAAAPGDAPAVKAGPRERRAVAAESAGRS